MRSLDLEFLRTHHRYSRIGLLVLILSLTALMGYGYRYWMTQQALTRIEDQWTAYRRQANRNLKKQLSPVDLRKIEVEIKVANGMIARLALPWSGLLREIDASTNDDVVLLSLEPDPERQEIKIIAEAKDVDAMIAYAKHMDRVQLLRQVRVTQHEYQVQDPQRPIRFTLQADWVGLHLNQGPVSHSRRVSRPAS